MKSKYMTTSVLLAIMASERTLRNINVPETMASTEGHQLLWSKGALSASEIKAGLKGRDELKLA